MATNLGNIPKYGLTQPYFGKVHKFLAIFEDFYAEIW